MAVAVLDFSTNEDFTQVIVKRGHVHYAADFIDDLYQTGNCRLHKHAEAWQPSYQMEDLEPLRAAIDQHLQGQNAGRFKKLMAQLLNCQKKERLKKADLAEEHGVDEKTIQREMQWFVKNRLVMNNVQFGYSPEPRLFKLMGG